MAADDELFGPIEVEAVEQRQGRHQRGGVDQVAAQRGQAQGSGAADAAKGADQPQSDTTIIHVFMNAGLWAAQTFSRESKLNAGGTATRREQCGKAGGAMDSGRGKLGLVQC